MWPGSGNGDATLRQWSSSQPGLCIWYVRPNPPQHIVVVGGASPSMAGTAEPNGPTAGMCTAMSLQTSDAATSSTSPVQHVLHLQPVRVTARQRRSGHLIETTPAQHPTGRRPHRSTDGAAVVGRTSWSLFTAPALGSFSHWAGDPVAPPVLPEPEPLFVPTAQLVPAHSRSCRRGVELVLGGLRLPACARGCHRSSSGCRGTVRPFGSDVLGDVTGA